jgi:hypothetical protein
MVPPAILKPSTAQTDIKTMMSTDLAPYHLSSAIGKPQLY